jgi:hypothetical protein
VCNIFNIDQDDINCWYKGLKYANKNRYFKVNDTMCVEMTNELYMIVDNTREVRDILRENVFCACVYAKTTGSTVINEVVKSTLRSYHHLFMDYNSSELHCDHINRNRFDNRSENLRIVTCQENMRNRSKFKTNTSGTTGVFYFARGKSWKAQIRNNENKQESKTFACKKYPNAKDMAVNWRKDKEIEYGYTNG